MYTKIIEMNKEFKGLSNNKDDLIISLKKNTNTQVLKCLTKRVS